jgi:hypothetical protein
MSKITRQKRKDNFTVVNNDILQNSKLSWAAKGMLVYLLHLPDGWQINVADLWNRSKNGRDATAAIIKELIQAGYVTRTKVKGEKNLFKGYDYTVSDEPTVNGFPVDGKSVFGDSVNGNPEASKDYQKEELSEERTKEVKVVELHSTPLLDKDEIEDIEQQIYHSKTTEKKERKSSAKKKEKADDLTPIRAMFELYADKYAELNNGVKPEFMVKYTSAMKNLYGILRARSITSGFVPLDNLEPWRDFLTAWADYLSKNEKEKWHRDNFNPLTFFSQFNSIIAKLNNRPKTDAEKWVEWGKRQGL